MCSCGYVSEGGWVDPTLTILLLLLPLLIILVSSGWLVVYVTRRVTCKLRKQSILTCLLIAAVFLVAYLPYIVYELGEHKIAGSGNLLLDKDLYR